MLNTQTLSEKVIKQPPIRCLRCNSLMMYQDDYGDVHCVMCGNVMYLEKPLPYIRAAEGFRGANSRTLVKQLSML